MGEKNLEEKGKQCLLWLRSNSLHRIKSAYKMVNLEQMGPRILNLLQQSCLDKQNFNRKKTNRKKRKKEILKKKTLMLDVCTFQLPLHIVFLLFLACAGVSP